MGGGEESQDNQQLAQLLAESAVGRTAPALDELREDLVGVRDAAAAARGQNLDRVGIRAEVHAAHVVVVVLRLDTHPVRHAWAWREMARSSP